MKRNKVATHNNTLALCTVSRSPRMSIIHMAPMVNRMVTTMKTTDSQSTSARLTPRYWEVWSATGAKVSDIWGERDSRGQLGLLDPSPKSMGKNVTFPDRKWAGITAHTCTFSSSLPLVSRTTWRHQFHFSKWITRTRARMRTCAVHMGYLQYSEIPDSEPSGPIHSPLTNH